MATLVPSSYPGSNDPIGALPTTPPPPAPPPASAPAPEVASAPIATTLTPPPPAPILGGNSSAGLVEKKPSLWSSILMGALWGLAGSAGQKHFGGGVAAGAAGAFEGQAQQQQLKFESLRAADSHTEALLQHNLTQQQSDDAKLTYAMKQAQYQAYLQDNFGIAPNLTIADQGDAAVAALHTTAQQNGGTIPPVATSQEPAPNGKDGSIKTYSPTQQQFNQNMGGYRKLIDTQRAILGEPPIDTATFNSMGFKGARQAATDAINFMSPTPVYNMNPNSAGYLPIVLHQREQFLQSYQNHKDANGNSDADPATIKQLQAGIDYLKSASAAIAPKGEISFEQILNNPKDLTVASAPGVIAMAKAALDDPNTPPEIRAQAEKANAAANAVMKLATNQAANEAHAKAAAQNAPDIIAGAAKKTAAVETAKQNADSEALGDVTKKGDAYIQTLPKSEQALVTEVGEGKVDGTVLGRYFYKNPRLLEEVTHAYSDFDTSRIKAYTKAYSDFTGAGKVSLALNAGSTALKHLRELQQLNTAASMIPGTEAHTAYFNKLNTVASELRDFYHMSGTNESIDSIKSGLGAKTEYNRNAAIHTQAASMGDKFGSFQQTWENASPSPVYQAKMPTIDQDAKAALAVLSPGFVATHPLWAPVKQTAPTARPVIINGKIVGTTVDGKTMIPVGPQG